MFISVKLSLKAEKSSFYLRSDPPKSPLRRGTLRRFFSPVLVHLTFANFYKIIRFWAVNLGISAKMRCTLMSHVPPFLRGARGDLALTVRKKSVTTFDLKLTTTNMIMSQSINRDQISSLRHSRQTNLSTAQAAITVRILSKILLMIGFCVIKLRGINNFSSDLTVTGRRQSCLISITRSLS